MSHHNQVTRSKRSMISALEDHAAMALDSLRHLGAGDMAYIKRLSTELRVLVCHVSRTEGLLWRVGSILGVSDVWAICYPGEVDINHPLARGLAFVAIPIRPAGFGPRDVPERAAYLRELFRSGQCLFVRGVGISPEDLITKVAGQIGTAHETDRIMEWLADVLSIELGAVPVLAVNQFWIAVLTLQHAERVLQKASQQGYTRRRPILPALTDLAKLAPQYTELALDSGVAADVVATDEGSLSFLIDGWSGFPVVESGLLEIQLNAAGPIRVTGYAWGDAARIVVHGLGSPLSFFVTPPALGSRWTLALTWSPSLVKLYSNGKHAGEAFRLPEIAKLV